MYHCHHCHPSSLSFAAALRVQVTDWLDYVLGKCDQPPSFMRREGPPERKRKKKPGEGSGGGGSSSRGTPPASHPNAGGGSARTVFGGAGPRSGPFGQVMQLRLLSACADWYVAFSFVCRLLGVPCLGSCAQVGQADSRACMTAIATSCQTPPRPLGFEVSD
jgi:hypothetical protein